MKYKAILFFLLCFVLTNEAKSQISTDLTISNETINRHSIGFGLGRLSEWTKKNSSRFYTANKGIALYLNYNYQISEFWLLQAFIHLDQVQEYDLNNTYTNGAYQITVSRKLIGNESNELFLFGGFSFVDEVTYMTSYAEDGNGNYTVRFFNVEKYNTPYANFGIEYVHGIPQKLQLGLRLNNYNDFIGFGRTDFTGFLRFNLHSKKASPQYFK
jgi:hypothetical protein